MRNFPTQYNLQPEDALYFCHIPKTAGMTFRTIVEDYFACEDICPATLNAHIANIPQLQLETYRLFRGHLVFVDLPGMLPQRNFVNVTMLRDPIARVISHYEYIRRTPGDPHYEAVSNMTLEEFCQRLTVGKVGKNIQTFYIAKTLRFNLERLSPQEVLEVAKESLDRYAFVGILERFQDSLFLLSYIFGWKPILNQRKENASATKTTYDGLPQSTIDHIREHSLLDIELYEYAQEIFNQRFDAMCVDLQANSDRPFSDSEQLRSLLEKHYEQRYLDLNLPPSDCVKYRFCDPLWGAGWQRRECPQNELAYRWTGPETISTLDLPVKADADLLVEFRVICNRSTAPDILDSLVLKVNNSVVPLTILLDNVSTRLYQARVSRSLLHVNAPFLSLAFEVNRVTSFNAINPRNPDKRKVGLAINEVQIFPAAQEGEKSAALDLFDSSYWTEVINFVQQRLQANDRVVVPLMAFKIKLQGELFDYETAIAKGIDFQWAILHKGMAKQVVSTTLKLMQRGLKPVFANDVFLVFSRADLPTLSYLSPHVKSLYLDRLKLYTTQQLKAFYVKYFERKVSS